jgi:hypothetical protein
LWCPSIGIHPTPLCSWVYLSLPCDSSWFIEYKWSNVFELRYISCDSHRGIFIQVVKDAGLYDRISQAFSVFSPVQTVGIQADHRTPMQLLYGQFQWGWHDCRFGLND